MPLAICAFVSLATAAIAFVVLVGGDVGSGTELIIVYLLFSAFVVAGLHFLAFAIIKWRGKPISKRATAYLDYACFGFIAVGLLDIVTFAPRYSLYLQQQTGDEALLLEEIRAAVVQQVADHCGPGAQANVKTDSSGTRFTFNYPPQYCAKLETLAEKDNESAVKLLAADAGFMTHQTETSFALLPEGKRTFTNPVVPRIRKVAALNEFGSYRESDPSNVLLSFVSMLVLPFALGFSALKTSLEFFANRLTERESGPAPG